MNRRTGFTISYFVCTWMYKTLLPWLEVLFSIICLNHLKTFWKQLEFKRSHADHILSFQSCSSHLGEQLKVCPWVRSSDLIISKRHPPSLTITFLLFFYENNWECLSKKDILQFQFWGTFSDDADIPTSRGVGDERKWDRGEGQQPPGKEEHTASCNFQRVPNLKYFSRI